LKTAIVANTRYVLKCEKSLGVFDEIKVMRIAPIQLDTSRRTSVQHYTITLRALSWA